jgi:hypothetical protein
LANIQLFSGSHDYLLRFYTLFNRKRQDIATYKREKQFFDLKVQSVALQSSKQGAGLYDNSEFAVYDFLISTFQV